jgi:hypothetical protein
MGDHTRRQRPAVRRLVGRLAVGGCLAATGLAVGAGGNRAGAQALMLQGFDLRLLRHADHILLPILLGGVDRVP